MQPTSDAAAGSEHRSTGRFSATGHLSANASAFGVLVQRENVATGEPCASVPTWLAAAALASACLGAGRFHRQRMTSDGIGSTAARTPKINSLTFPYPPCPRWSTMMESRADAHSVPCPQGGLAGPPTGAERARMWAGLSFLWEYPPAMEILPARIPGPVLIAPSVFGDERGFFVETYRQQWHSEAGIPEG